MAVTSLTAEDMILQEVHDVYLDKGLANIQKTVLQNVIGKGDKAPIMFGVRLHKKPAGSEEYEIVDLETADAQFIFFFTRPDGKTKELTWYLEEDYGPGPLTPGQPVQDSWAYGKIDESCTEISGPFRLAVVMKDAPTATVERTVWIVEGMIADTNSGSTF